MVSKRAIASKIVMRDFVILSHVENSSSIGFKCGKYGNKVEFRECNRNLSNNESIHNRKCHIPTFNRIPRSCGISWVLIFYSSVLDTIKSDRAAVLEVEEFTKSSMSVF
ncbi:hypothetical protein RF11_02362 [Thelohanellus kitauei]|uniref:Uncharacterized protein n=1 Tax=Thelohanellus kitauei TaxID=669202 RepID=A0A0C2JM99_THEKT|nr:hypothetical protein RF11_02362 [Thelohanellus kitauei]